MASSFTGQSLSELARTAQTLIRQREGSPAHFAQLIQTAKSLLPTAELHSVSEIVDVLGHYNAPVVRPLMEQACRIISKDFTVFSFAQVARMACVFRGYSVGPQSFYLQANTHLLESFAPPQQEELAKLTHAFSRALAGLHDRETIYWPLEKCVTESEHLVWILQGYVAASKGSEQFYTQVYDWLRRNLALHQPQAVGLAVHFLTKLDISIDVQPFEEYLIESGDFEAIVESVQDLQVLKHDCARLTEAAVTQLSQARSLVHLSILEYALRVQGTPVPEALKQQRRVAFFLSTSKERFQDLKVRFKLHQLE